MTPKTDWRTGASNVESRAYSNVTIGQMDAGVRELVDAVETSFGVRFDEGELADESTVDDLYHALTVHLGTASPDRCLTAIVFWRLRRALIQLLGLPKTAIRPSTPIEDLIPAWSRRKLWPALSKTAGLRLPGLEYPSSAAVILFALAWAPCLAVALWMRGSIAAIISTMAVPFVACGLIHVAKPLATGVPWHSRTVGQTARTVVGPNYAALVQQHGTAHARELRIALMHVLIDRILTEEPVELTDGILFSEPYDLDGRMSLLEIADSDSRCSV